MSKEIIIDSLNKDFESIKRADENGVEYWEARELMPLLGYDRWENFEKVIKKVKVSCFESGQKEENHFRDIRKMVEIGSNTVREVRQTIKDIGGTLPEDLPAKKHIKELKSEKKKLLKKGKKVLK